MPAVLSYDTLQPTTNDNKWTLLAKILIATLEGGGASSTLTQLGVTRKTKAADTTRSNTDTATADPDLTFAIGANETWAFELYLPVDDDAGADIKFGFTGPASPSGVSWGTQAFGEATLSYSGRESSYTTVITALGPDAVLLIRGTVINGATAGNVSFVWAQGSADAGNLKVLKGAHLIATKL